MKNSEFIRHVQLFDQDKLMAITQAWHSEPFIESLLREQHKSARHPLYYRRFCIGFQ